jgi:hypothetical protein
MPRKRKYLIGATLALAASVAIAAIAQAASTGQSLTVQVSATKQDKKVRGPADINVTVDTQEAAPFNAATQGQDAQQTVVDFDKDFTFTAGALPTCNPTSLTGSTTEAALAACGRAKVGSGAATLCEATATLQGCAATPGGGIQGVVTAFNGVPSGGNQSIILHARFGPPANTTTVLTGVLTNSPLGNPYGKRLVVSVPPTGQSTGLHLTHFQTSIPRLISVKANKKKGKPAKYYVSAKCSDKTWDFQETTTFRSGGPTLSAHTTAPCKQKPAKKK